MIRLGCCIVKSVIRVDNNFFIILLALLALSILAMIIFLERKYINMSDNSNCNDEILYSIGSNVEDVYFIYNMIMLKHEYISPNFEKIFGIKSSNLENNIYLLFDSIDSDNKEALIGKLSPDVLHGYQEAEFTYLHPVTQKDQRFLIKIYPVYKVNQINRLIICIKDITEEYKAKTAIREELLVTRRANEAKKDFLSHMSHELKTPINAILGMSKIASSSLDNPEKVLDCLEKISYSSRNLLLLIDNILENVKRDNDKLILNYEPFYLKKTLELFSSLIHVQAEMKHQNYHMIIDKIQHDYLLGDSLRLTQILNNCLYNSLKFTPQGGGISLEVMELQVCDHKSIFRFIISDTGKGMHEKFLNQIFDAFVQEDERIGVKYGGSGLGMSIVKTLLTLMNGNIHVESQIGKGTRITIDIEFEHLPNPDDCSNTDASQPCNNNPSQNAHILVVEDNEINLEITCEFLKILKLEHATATSGEEAIQLFRASPENYFDIILMDIQLPDADGFETANKIRSLARPDSDKVQIIALSANDYEKGISGIRSCMNGYITKPVDIEKLSSIIQNSRHG